MNKSLNQYQSVWHFIKNFVRITPLSNYVLINDSGIYYFGLGEGTKEPLISSLFSDYSNFDQNLSVFLDKLTNYNLYYGQPITILIGGSRNFYQIKRIKQKSRVNPHTLFDWLNHEEVFLKFRYFKNRKNEKFVYFAGIKKDLQETLIKRFGETKIPIQGFKPVTLFVLEQWLNRQIDKPILVKLPGQIVKLFINKNKLSFLEESYHNISNSNSLENHKVIALSDLIKEPYFRFNTKKSFFDCGETNKLTRLLIPITNAIRLTSLLLISLCLISLLVGIGFRIWKSGYGGVLKTYQAEYEKKTELQLEISNIKKKLTQSNFRDLQQTYFAGAICAFCQKRPWGLYLKEINLNNDNENGWFLTAKGLSDKENSVFNYREYISECIGDVPLEVTWLKQTENRNRSRDQQATMQYNFSIKLNAINSK